MTESDKLRADTLLRTLTRTASLAHSVAEALIANTGQSLARWQVLDLFGVAPATVPAVARRLQQTRQSTQRIADILLREGLIERRSNPDHRTSPLFAATPAGSAVLEQIGNRVEPWLEYVGARFSDSDLSSFLKHLDKLRELATAYADSKRE